VATSTAVAALVGPMCSARGVGLVVADEGDRVDHPALQRDGVLRRTEQHWQQAYVLGQWASRYLDGSLFQLVTREEELADGVLALRAGYTQAGGAVAGSVAVWPKSASAAALVARASGARVVAVHATGHQLEEIVRALRDARVQAEIVAVGRGIDEHTLVELGRRGPLYAAMAWHDRADSAAALGHDVARALVDASRREVPVDLAAQPPEHELVVRRADSGRVTVVARRDVPVDVPDLDLVDVLPSIASMPRRG
jgi:hypothetical protein